MSGFFRWLLVGLLCGCGLSAAAQTAPARQLPTHVVRSISPTDTSFADLEFLVREIRDARVVMLGEPTHGEGNVTEAKIRLIHFLKDRMGFTTVAFESGFYELDRVQRALEAGAPVAETVRAGVYPVWTATQEFQFLLPLLGKSGLRVAGFDSQLGGMEDVGLEELEEFLKPEKGADAIAYDYLDECLSMMSEQNIFPPSHQIVLFNQQLGKARRLLEKVQVGSSASRRERAAFWLQNLRSVQALAHDYATNDPSAKDSTEWTATTSNPRDAQMADNLLWYLRRYPREKVLCWGALPHLANKAEALQNAEIREYRPMGRAVKAALGDDAVYVLGTLAGGGTYGFGCCGKPRSVPAPAPGSLEAALLAQGHEYSFLSLKHDARDLVLTTSAFQYGPLTGRWSEVVDGFLFLKSVNPPHAAVGVALAATPDEGPAPAEKWQRARLNPKVQPGAKGGVNFVLDGVVVDRKTGAPVPFATVAVPGRSAGTICDALGRFRLDARRGEAVQVSSLGYEPATLTAQPTAALTVRIQPASFALADVRVSAQTQDPRRIMKKVIKAADANYEQQDYVTHVYTRRRLTSFDTLHHEVEYVSQIFEPAGHRAWGGGFLMLGPTQSHAVQEKHVVVPSVKPLTLWDYSDGGHGFYTEGSDPVRISPLFRLSTLGKFALRLDTIEQHGGETVYVIQFAAKRASKRTTGFGLIGGYSGKVYIREQDYAVVRYEALWRQDTLRMNAAARKYLGKHNLTAAIFSRIFTDHRKAHVVTYRKGADGRYHLAASVAQSVTAGRVLRSGKPFHDQKYCEEQFSQLPADKQTPQPDKEKQLLLREGELRQLAQVPYRPEFWKTYQRPAPAGPGPVLEAAKP
ncbi:erythromycin esterase family protein [Hymenobacter sp. BT175]|uniref:erythromycin esterase family protein n=1 Tax=Hymenobacter translucens TaxID=2886507 RepID=UPI001D0E630C|nr:erythromycin esterase family protein [Hymenobacter translucens]MCC2548912.1 erythromycin esterase family protein [Hymenobacter translucens]